MIKHLYPVTVFLVLRRSKFTNRITFYLMYRDRVEKKPLPELTRRLEFYAFGDRDFRALQRAEQAKLEAQLHINQIYVCR